MSTKASRARKRLWWRQFTTKSICAVRNNVNPHRRPQDPLRTIICFLSASSGPPLFSGSRITRRTGQAEARNQHAATPHRLPGPRRRGWGATSGHRKPQPHRKARHRLPTIRLNRPHRSLTTRTGTRSHSSLARGPGLPRPCDHQHHERLSAHHRHPAQGRQRDGGRRETTRVPQSQSIFCFASIGSLGPPRAAFSAWSCHHFSQYSYARLSPSVTGGGRGGDETSQRDQRVAGVIVQANGRLQSARMEDIGPGGPPRVFSPRSSVCRRYAASLTVRCRPSVSSPSHTARSQSESVPSFRPSCLSICCRAALALASSFS